MNLSYKYIRRYLVKNSLLLSIKHFAGILNVLLVIINILRFRNQKVKLSSAKFFHGLAQLKYFFQNLQLWLQLITK
jgi:hypothetical protein